MPDTAVLPLPYTHDSADYFRRLAAFGQRVWLDSGRPHDSQGRYDILAAAPVTCLENPAPGVIEEAIHALGGWPAEAAALPFAGGALGYFNYEYHHASLGLSSRHRALRPSMVGIFAWALVVDHRERHSYLICTPRCEEATRASLLATLLGPTPDSNNFSVEKARFDCDREAYDSAFAAIHAQLRAGNAYQINYAQRFQANFGGDAATTYLALRQVMPSPYSAYFELGTDRVLSFSPERFIRIEGDQVLTQPIKGTAPRGRTRAEDAALAQALQNSEKNRAENVMIVDLLRNDFSQHCLPHSVKVSKLCALESFANVHHLVSSIEGTLPTGSSRLEFFLSCFPGGSITGAPKLSAMAIIDSLETQARNIYCGSAFYLSQHDRFDSNIAIRTLLVSDGKIFCWGGSGIVIDSEAEEEYRESLQKVAVLIEALEAGT